MITSFMLAHPYLGAFIICYCFTVMSFSLAHAFGPPTYYIQEEEK